jgi:hypothetical protein
MTVQTLPQYLSVSQDERGDSFGLSWDDYRHLARSALAIIQEERLTMGLYRFDQGAALDIFGESNCLTLVVSENQDSGAGAICLLTVDNCEEGWRKLVKLAREEIQT